MNVTATDVVDTHEEAGRLSLPPLLVREPLAAFLAERGIGSGELRVAPIGNGHSNVTYAVEHGVARVIVRRPPRPPLPPSAHDVVREARVQLALSSTAVPVPRVLAVCEDAGVIGAPFYVMEHVEGVVVADRPPKALTGPRESARIGAALIDALVALHAVDPAAVGMQGLGRPEGYLERQLGRFAKLWDDNRTRELADVERAHAWLVAHMPRSSRSAIVHGDFRLGNALFAPTAPATVKAILDWEMATLGDPLTDLGYLTATWAHPGDDDTPMLALSAATRAHGFLSAEGLRALYEARSGMSTAGLRWYQVLALWKACVFLESSYSRFLSGTTHDPYFATLGEGVPALARSAMRQALGS
jgi:aminoglycoside phosphotransferase (APT) family kinase protein